VVRVLERELLHPARLAALERHQQALLRKYRKETLRTRTKLETRVAEIKAEQHAQLRSIAAGIDPVLVKEVVEELQLEERQIRERLRQLDGPTDVMRALSAIRGLREHADDLRTALRHGDPNDQRKIFTRTIRSLTLAARRGTPGTEVDPAAARRGSRGSWRACGFCTCPGWDSNPHAPYGAGHFK
jgi:hypothetical protein